MVRQQPDWYFISDSRAWTSSAMLMVDLCSCNTEGSISAQLTNDLQHRAG